MQIDSQTLNIGIRRFEEQDIEDFFSAVRASIDTVYPWLPWCKPDYTLRDSADWVGSRNFLWEAGLDYSFLIYRTNSGKILGGVSINQIVREHKVANLGYWVRSDETGNGYATEAARLSVNFGFMEAGLNRVEIHVAPKNLASIRVAHKLGAVHEGRVRNKLVLHGKPIAADVFSLIPSDMGL